MAEKYLDLIRIAYPMSNKAYVITVNNEVLNSKPNDDVNIETGLEPRTIVMLEAAGLFNKANKEIR